MFRDRAVGGLVRGGTLAASASHGNLRRKPSVTPAYQWPPGVNTGPTGGTWKLRRDTSGGPPVPRGSAVLHWIAA